MTRILSDNNSRILTAPWSDPLEGGRAELCYLQLSSLAFLLTILAFKLAIGVFLLTGAEDCKQKNSTVSKETPTVVKKLPSFQKGWFWRIFPRNENRN